MVEQWSSFFDARDLALGCEQWVQLLYNVINTNIHITHGTEEFMTSDPDNLIPELQDWNEGRGIDLSGYLQCLGNYELAIAFVHFFWPSFVEHDGCVLRVAPDIKNYEDWKKSFAGDRSGIESMLNHVHIVDIFPNVDNPPTRQQILYLGRQLQAMWISKLQRDFRDKQFAVEFHEDGGDDLVEYQITCYQIRP